MKNILLIMLLLLPAMNANAENLKDLFNVKYDIFSEEALFARFPELKGKIEKIGDTGAVYAVGYISRTENAQANYMIEIEFYNPEKIAYRAKERIGWIALGKFFLVYLGSPESFSKIDYTVNILMTK